MNWSERLIGMECREARMLKGVSLRKMQELTGYDKSRLSRFEAGKFDEDIFLYYYAFWEEYNFNYVLERVPSHYMRKILEYTTFEDYFARHPQYCIYNRMKENRYMILTDHSCSEDYWDLKNKISRISMKIKNNEFKR